jgi:hypothetical protein
MLLIIITLAVIVAILLGIGYTVEKFGDFLNRLSFEADLRRYKREETFTPAQRQAKAVKAQMVDDLNWCAGVLFLLLVVVLFEMFTIDSFTANFSWMKGCSKYAAKVGLFLLAIGNLLVLCNLPMLFGAILAMPKILNRIFNTPL